MTESTPKACIKCCWFEPRSGFCRKHPPTPVIVPDKLGTHMMSAFPKIPAPNFDWCSEFCPLCEGNVSQLLSE